MGNKNRKSGYFLLKMNTFDLMFHYYQSMQSDKYENDLVMGLSCPVFYPIRKTARKVVRAL
jgi:hypothetical protein